MLAEEKCEQSSEQKVTSHGILWKYLKQNKNTFNRWETYIFKAWILVLFKLIEPTKNVNNSGVRTHLPIYIYKYLK